MSSGDITLAIIARVESATVLSDNIMEEILTIKKRRLTNMTYENNTQYQRQLELWREAKQTEQEANAVRLKAEKELVNIAKADLKEKGTNNFPDNLQIVTGIAESFEQLDIDTLYIDFEKENTDLPYFPFDQVWKPNTTKLKAIKESWPAQYKKYIEPILTVKPKKPSFKVKG